MGARPPGSRRPAAAGWAATGCCRDWVGDRSPSLGETGPLTRGQRALAAALPKPLLQRSGFLSTRPPTPSPGLGAAGRLSPAQESAPGPSRLLSKILSECEDADEIEYLEDGSWCPIRAEKERSCSPQCPILVLGESQP